MACFFSEKKRFVPNFKHEPPLNDTEFCNNIARKPSKWSVLKPL